MSSDRYLGNSLADAKAWLKARLGDGAHCPCCNQWTKMARRPLTANIAKPLVVFYRRCGTEWGNKKDVLAECSDTRYETILRHWELFEERPAVDGRRTGEWRVTEKGRDWLHGLVTVQRTALIYNNRCFGFEGPEWTLEDAAAEEFDPKSMLRGGTS